MHFNIDGPFWQFITVCTRFFILNMLFVMTIIPIITIGPARAALYSTVFAYSDNDGIDLGREYLRRLKREFTRAIGSSLIFLILAAAILFALAFWYSSNTDLSYVALPIIIIAGVIFAVTFEYHFPLQARYASTFRQTWKNSFVLPWATFGKTLILLSIDVAACSLFIYTNYLRIAFVLLGFSWIAYAKSLIYLKIFNRVGANPSKPHERPDYSMPTASL